MKKYFAQIQQKPPHERRLHAMQISGIIVAVIFAGWLATLGVRLASQDPAVAQGGSAAQTADVVEAASGNATLLVGTSSDSQ